MGREFVTVQASPGKLRRLADHQVSLEDALAGLRQIRNEMNRDHASALFWGNLAVFCNVLLVPLNVIVNALPAPNVKRLYQRLVKVAYEEFAQSGTRLSDGSLIAILGRLKEMLVTELARMGLTDLAVVVRVLIGLYQDCLALYESMEMVSSAGSEQARRAEAMRRTIRKAEEALRKAQEDLVRGVEQAQLLSRMA